MILATEPFGASGGLAGAHFRDRYSRAVRASLRARKGGKETLPVSAKPEPFAGEKVTVTGTYDKEANAIHVTDIRPKIILVGLLGRD